MQAILPAQMLNPKLEPGLWLPDLWELPEGEQSRGSERLTHSAKHVRVGCLGPGGAGRLLRRGG